MSRAMNQPAHSDNSTGSVVLRLSGEYDISRKDELNAALSAAYNATEAILDVRDVSYIDSTAIECLIRLRKRMSENGSSLIRLVGPTRQVRKVLQLTGLHQVFELSETSEDVPLG
jgi:anti-anti-sigma factor